MGVNVPTSSDYEAEANRVRKEIDETVRELRSRLTPSSLASEVAVGVGLTDASWGEPSNSPASVIPFRQPSPDSALHCGRWWRSETAPNAVASPVSHRP